MINRFERQEILNGFGVNGQQKLRESRVLVVGAGGLGCPALLYLAAAGVGTIGIADGDIINASNLNRQVLYGVDDIGQPKAHTAAQVLNLKYPDIQINIHQEFLNIENVVSILEIYDLIIDGTDNFPTRYMLNDVCVLMKKPYIMAAIYQYEGQIAVFNLPDPHHRPLHYRDVYPVSPTAHEIPNCNDVGVLGVLPGIIGTLQAVEALKILSELGSPMTNKLINYNLLNSTFYEIILTPNQKADQLTPKNFGEFYKMDYVLSCSGIEFINWKEVLEVLKKDKPSLLVDVREKDELPPSLHLDCLHVPIAKIEQELNQFQNADAIYLFCQTGIRSEKAAIQLKRHFPNKHIYSIREGLRHQDSPF